MAGAIAQAYYKAIPRAIHDEVIARLDPPLIALVERFNVRYDVSFELT